MAEEEDCDRSIGEVNVERQNMMRIIIKRCGWSRARVEEGGCILLDWGDTV